MTISQMENMSLLFLMLAIVFVIVSIFLFFVFDISKICKISSKEYAKQTKQISSHIKFDDVKKNVFVNREDTTDEVWVEKNICKYTGSEPTELISNVICDDSLMSMPVSGMDSEDGLGTILLECASFSDGEPTQPLDNTGISLLQDITYTNSNQ